MMNRDICSRRQDPREPASDEDSDEEGLRRSARNRQEAKFPVTNRQMLLRLLILGGAIRAKARAPDPTTNQDFLVISNMIHMGEGPQVCVGCTGSALCCRHFFDVQGHALLYIANTTVPVRYHFWSSTCVFTNQIASEESKTIACCCCFLSTPVTVGRNLITRMLKLFYHLVTSILICAVVLD